MVSILPPNQTIWDRLGAAIGGGLEKGIGEGFQRGQTQNVFNQIDPNASVVDQLKTLAPILHTPHGRAAMQYLMESQKNRQRDQQFNDIFNPQNQPGAHGPREQTTPDFSNVTDEQLAQLSIKDPQRANSLRQIVYSQRDQKAHQQKADQDTLSNTLYSKGYKALQEGDDEALNDIISDEKTPYDVKRQLTTLKNQSDVRRSVDAREKRTRLNNLKSSYTKAINFEKNLLSRANYKEKPEIKKRIENLARLQKSDMKAFSEDPNSYHKLSIWNSDAAQYIPEEEFNEDEGLNNMMGAEDEEFEGAQPQPKQGQKVKFNPKNPEHASYLQRILQQTGGDRKKTNEILAQEFSV